MDTQKAINKIWETECLKCKYVERGSKCTACQKCEYNFAINAIAKTREYDKIGLSPKEVRRVLTDRNYYRAEFMKRCMPDISIQPSHEEKNEGQVIRKEWKELRNSGLLWWINMILHTFGWAICYEMENSEIANVYPARVKYRGFSEDANSEGYMKVSKYIKENAEILHDESCK